jgi:biopolymer transport protein ExbB/TolQ
MPRSVETVAADAPGQRARAARLFRYPVVLALSLAGALLIIAAIHYLLPEAIAVVLVDYGQVTYPFTVQNVSWLVFALGIAELIVRARDAAAERAELGQGYLPEDETTVLQGPDLKDLYARARRAVQPDQPSYGRFLPRLIQRIVTQVQTNHSAEQANAILDSSLDLYMHEIDLRYTMVRYVIWAIPALGFLGTVIGIAMALAYAGGADLQDPTLLAEVTKRLAVAFNTTLLALCLSAVLVLVQHLVQAYEERALNLAGQYCLDNLINRLFID